MCQALQAAFLHHLVKSSQPFQDIRIGMHMNIFTYGERATNCGVFTISHMKHPAECLINILPLHLLGSHTIPMLLMRKQPLRSLITYLRFSSVQSLSPVRLFATPWTTAHQASLSITNSWSPPKPMSIESVIPSSHLILCRPLLLPSIFPSISLFKWVSSSHHVAKVLEFQLQHQSFQWTPRTNLL